MTLYGFPILYALFIWWFSTGAIFYLDGLPQRTFRWSMAGATVLLAAAVTVLTLTSADVSATGAYAGFTCGLTVWGWLEIGYYMGFMVGPRRQAAPVRQNGWRHFVQAAETTLYHEIAAIALLALIAAVTWDMPNKTALWTFLILWVMQLSAKLNVFLGVANLAEDFLPEHLAFLRHFMTRKPMNLFFPISVTISVVLATVLVGDAASAVRPFDAVSLTMLSTLVVLAILEHWFLVLPLPFEALWRWSLGSRTKTANMMAASHDQDHDPGADFHLSRKSVGPIFSDPGLTHPNMPLMSRRPV